MALFSKKKGLAEARRLISHAESGLQKAAGERDRTRALMAIVGAVKTSEKAADAAGVDVDSHEWAKANALIRKAHERLYRFCDAPWPGARSSRRTNGSRPPRGRREREKKQKRTPQSVLGAALRRDK